MNNRVKRYFNDLEPRFTVFSNKLHVINYKKIISLEDSRVSILFNNKRIVFKGNSFILNKLLDHEVLINGYVTNIEVFDV